jgi:hypothetical protein
MSVATSAEGILNGATPRPKQCKLLGANVRDLGTVVAVSQRLTWGYALVEGADRVTRHVFLADLRRDMVTYPAEPQPYRAATERVGIGLWDEVYSLLPAAVSLKVAA